ncbi:hypothetical protein BS47DRAFT_1365202 [Hydnum rufescens UP504]|uniref:Tyr recombinase domain-containing protein n=1 Tax=Hydnum rufescens UP504 TaxID=1448309 RepID=A0A9P6ARB9_9AGAM|nr:hypothetical protein BS47DRAFT_1365202 [Hydnum rufescens UP504]
MPLSQGHYSHGRQPKFHHNIFCPHVKASDCILCWTSPAVILAHTKLLESSSGLSFSLARAQLVASKAWEESTHASYGAGLARWAEWCDDNEIPEDDRMPIEKRHLACFIADATGTIGLLGFKNWLSGLGAWHRFHQMPWCRDDPFIHLLLEGAKKLAPKSILMMLLAGQYYVLPFGVWHDLERSLCLLKLVSSLGTMYLVSVTLQLPWMKTACNGANLVLTQEEDCTCPYWALQQHFLTNQGLPDQAHLFAFHTETGWEPLIKRHLVDRCRHIWSSAGFQDLPLGHSFCIGGTTHLLSRGTNPQVIQKLGRWSSDAFFLYWHNTQLIIPKHIHDAGVVARMDSKMEDYFGDVSPEVLQWWRAVQSTRQRTVVRR